MTQQISQTQEEWLRVLTKGMVTIPKAWREELGFEEGELIKAKKIANKIIFEQTEKTTPYRVYSQAELNKFLKDDVLPKKLALKIDKKLEKLGRVK